jgi:hypothetical protein
MTEYEVLDLVGTWKADTLANGTSYTSILFAYVVAAYFAGAKLSRPQVVILTVLMLWHCSLNLFTMMVNMQSMIEYHELMRPEWGEPAVRNLEVNRVIIGVGGVGGILAVLYFMWSIRHPKTE